MFSLIEGKLYWDELCLSEMKNIERIESVDGDFYKITKPDDSIVNVFISLLIPDYIRMFDAFVDEFTAKTDNYETVLSKLKQDKINELNVACSSDIYSGFYSNAKLDENNNPVEAFYSFDDQDQSNMTGLLALIGSNTNKPIYWKAADELISYPWTPSEFIQLCEDSYDTKLSKMHKFHVLRLQVLACVTTEEVENICWENSV